MTEEKHDNNNNNGEERERDFLYPLSKYYGEFTFPNLVFDANLQEFAQKISYICNLETNGKITPEAAYEYIKQCWDELQTSRERLFDDREES